MNRQETAKLVAVIRSACPAQGGKLTNQQQLEMLDAYHALLSDLTYEQCNAAVCVLLQTRSWMPSVADIRSTALDLDRGPSRPGGEAWGSVQRAIHEQGVYRRPGVDFVFHDSTTARCVAALGWTELCNSELQTADRARFIELYDKLAAETRRELQAPQLAAARERRELAMTELKAELRGVLSEVHEHAQPPALPETTTTPAAMESPFLRALASLVDVESDDVH